MKLFLIKVLSWLYCQAFYSRRKLKMIFHSKKKAKKAREAGHKMVLAHLKKYPNPNYERQKKLAEELQFLEGLRPDPD